MIPTMNFIVFSGTRVSGAWTRTPAIVTTSTAVIAASAARGMLRWLAPRVTTTSATSRPSRTTPLNDRVKAYQSPTTGRRMTAAASAAATSVRSEEHTSELQSRENLV